MPAELVDLPREDVMTQGFQLREQEQHRETEDEDLAAAIQRALDAAQDAPLLEHIPWRMHLLEPEAAAAVAWFAARNVEREHDAEDARAAYEQWRAIPGWIIVTIDIVENSHQAARNREDCLTAVQRASLSLWSDNVPSNWIDDLLPDQPTLVELTGEDPKVAKAVGILVFGHVER